MEPIHVLRPPQEAFNKDRRISDLIRKQVEHFKHLEHKLPEHLRSQLPQHHIVTEDDAARYIAPMTRLLMSQSVTVPQAQLAPLKVESRAIKSTSRLASLAAGAEEPEPKIAASKAKPAKKTAARSRKVKKR
jgi:hypothetical protein